MRKLCDLWLAPEQGTDAAMALAMGHVQCSMANSTSTTSADQYFTDYVRRYTDMPMLVMLEETRRLLRCRSYAARC